MLSLFKYAALLLILSMACARAEVCPTPEQIRDRKISKDYDWSVEEVTTLDQLLAVKKLYSVRILDQGKTISCRYTTEKWPVRLDGDPLDEKCGIITEAGEWKGTESGELACQEEDVTKCGFKQECKK